ncbi:hypothetical protein [Virgisporangium ochraceum]|uniref:Uncharacterized protein n=1 Tax=Virgisporangium ochraceum TaxID=65505 RepID=A0A8J4A0P1_9ACTN|nr:hypothetical protein [Virgisporangium ochraceum]GIJ70955.1 hypothetical protein Voc01_058720 [Virgisporangium ochraceum]
MMVLADFSALIKIVLCCLVAGFFLGFCAAESSPPREIPAPSTSVSAR